MKYSETLSSLPCWKVVNPEDIFDLFKHLFLDQTSKRGQILTKKNFLSKESHILLKFSFLLFWSILGKFIENFFYRHKSDYRGNEHWKIQKVSFSYHVWKCGKSLGKLGFVKTTFLMKPVKGTNIKKNCYSPQRETYTSKLCIDSHFLD